MVEALIGLAALTGAVLAAAVAFADEVQHDKHAHEKILKLSGCSSQTLI